MFKPYRLFRLRFVTEGEDGGGDPKPGSEELGFPADTDPADMTPEEQIAYWKNDSQKWKSLSRKHEKNQKPKDFDQIVADAQSWRDKADADLKPEDKAAKDAVQSARAEGLSAGRNSLLPDAVAALVKAKRPHMGDEDIEKVLRPLDLEKFLDDEGGLDREAVTDWADSLAQPEVDDDDTSNQFNLGHILSRGGARQKNKGVSIDEVRARTLAKYKTQK